MTLRNQTFRLIHLTRIGCWILSELVHQLCPVDQTTTMRHNGNRWIKDPNLDPARGPRPHETYQLAYLWKGGEVPSRTPTEPDISRVGDSAASVPARPPTEPDLQSSSSVGNPETQVPTTGSRIQPPPTSQQAQGRQHTSPCLPSKRLGVREEEAPIQSDQVSEMGEVTVGIRFGQQQRSGQADDRRRSSNAVTNDSNSWGTATTTPTFPSTLTPTPGKRWNNLQIPQRRWNNLWTHPKTWNEDSLHVPSEHVDLVLHHGLHHKRNPDISDTRVRSATPVHRLRL